jgi:SAM-dependent methyltransferase
MTPVRGLADGIGQASVTARPWSRESIAMRNRNQAEMLSDCIRAVDIVLEVGCEAAYLTKCFEETFGAETAGVGAQDFRVVQLPFREFDGRSILFPDSTFDHVVVSLTLHHCHDPMTLVGECRRVVRRTIMAFENLPEARLGRMLVALHVEAFW